MKIFIPVVGQFTNVGDVMHRRVLLNWLKDAGTLHVYVGKAPDLFIKSLELSVDTVIYRSLFKWLMKILFTYGRNSHFIFNPGEINLRWKRILGELLLFPFILLIKINGGKALRIGIAAKTTRTKFKWLWKFLFSISTKVYWRTEKSYEYFHQGEVAPDLAFFEGSLHEKIEDEKNLRPFLTISMRFDKPEPSDKWVEAVKSLALKNNLKIIVVSQVRPDNSRTQLIANLLDAESVFWDDEISHSEQELIVRKIYAKTQLLISDRLHVLIAGATELAIPAVILTSKSTKVEDHFVTISYPNVSIDENDYSLDTILNFLEAQLLRRDELVSCLEQAKSRLIVVKGEVQLIIK